MKARLAVNADGSEQIAYNTSLFPVRTVNSTLSVFYNYAAACHWHRDFEFLLVTEGSIEYFVNGDIISVSKGQAVFVNSNRLHYGFSSQKKECHYFVFLYHPKILGEGITPIAEHIDNLTGDQSRNWLLLDEDHYYGAQSLALIRRIGALCQDHSSFYEFQVQSACAELLSVLGIALHPNVANRVEEISDWSALRQMVGYIQTHYQEQVLLEEIASAGAICKSKCCHLFRDYLGHSPIEHLTRYRLDKASLLLSLGGDSITDIALECGFNSASYFSETYRKMFGISPRAYRERLKNENKK